MKLSRHAVTLVSALLLAAAAERRTDEQAQQRLRPLVPDEA